VRLSNIFCDNPAGFPGIIIEHAFVTNKSDASFMGNEDNLQKMGHADLLALSSVDVVPGYGHVDVVRVIYT